MGIMQGILICQLCGCPVQRTMRHKTSQILPGTLAEGLAAHYETVHPTEPLPELAQ